MIPVSGADGRVQFRVVLLGGLFSGWTIFGVSITALVIVAAMVALRNALIGEAADEQATGVELARMGRRWWLRFGPAAGQRVA
jgi:hypothetical protein